MKYTYPAIFRPEEKGFSIFFPDIRMGGTQGEDIRDGLEMAHDFLIGAMLMLEDEGQKIPTPSDINDLDLKADEFPSFISVDTDAYRRNMETKAESFNINRSKTLQRALKEDLKIAN